MNPWLIIAIAALGAITLMCIAALIKREDKAIDEENPYLNSDCIYVLPDDMQEYAADMPKKPARKSGIYEKVFKRTIDIVMSFLGLVILSPVYLALVVWIKIDDPGPVFFKQKRVGRDKTFFYLHKFRSMKMSTPHDVPTHQLDDPDSYITRSGRFLRKSSLDELPQIWDIFRGRMSIIGPRPALWNQADLINEREKYAANDVKPGLTGWAQINGRDELEIQVKAKLDGEYVENQSLLFDIRCFIGTVFSVVKSEGVVEGGTGKIEQQKVESK